MKYVEENEIGMMAGVSAHIDATNRHNVLSNTIKHIEHTKV